MAEKGTDELFHTSQGILQISGHQPDGLEKYFQVLPLVENFLREKMEKGTGNNRPPAGFPLQLIEESLYPAYGQGVLKLGVKSRRNLL